MDTQSSKSSSDSAKPPVWLKVVQEKVERLRYGTVQITIHDGRVTQVETSEKVRFDPPPSRAPNYDI
jgi:hypothetical protein